MFAIAECDAVPQNCSMTIWIPDREHLKPPLHTSLAELMEAAIRDGRLRVGTRLPAHRSLAKQLTLSVQTVSKAYDELRRMGLVDGQVGRGTYVLDPAKPSQQPFLMERSGQDVLDLSISRPLYGTVHVTRMQEALAGMAASLDPDVYLACRPNIGLPQHREIGVEWLKTCGLNAPEETIVITNGVCHGLSTALASIARPGDTVVCERITHHLISSICAYLGLQLRGLEMDEEGILPEAFEDACRRQKVTAYFAVPSLANPTVSVMSAGRRRDLAAIAQKHGVTILEDDAWGPVMEDRPPPIASFLPDQTIYMTSFTKCIMPGLRAGYMVAPQHLLPAITGRIIAFSWMASPMMAELASRWVMDGTAQDLVTWQRRELAVRYAVVRETMQGFDWSGHPASLHFWLRLPENWKPASFIEHARARGVAVASPHPFAAADDDIPNAVRIAVCGHDDAEQLRRALSSIRDLLKGPKEPLTQIY